jgi:hypothetical protein
MVNWRSVKPLNSDNIINDFEKEINYTFPDDFKEFVKTYNGGRPSHKVFNTKVTKDRVLNNMLSFNKEDKCSIWEINDWNGRMRDWNTNGEMENYIAFAMDAFGNLICFDKTTDKIFFVDHEDLSVEFISNTFTVFLKRLRKG